MAKSKINIDPTLLVLGGIVWFLVISFISAQTEYQNLVADRLADPTGTSTQLEGILNILIVLISFMPSGFLITYPYIIKNYRDHRFSRLLFASFCISLALFIPFGLYNFAVNFPK